MSARLALYYLQSSREKYAETAEDAYIKKISPIISFSVERLKSPAMARKVARDKIRVETEMFLKALKPRDLVILFDEKGRSAESSQEFSQILVKCIEQSAGRVVLVIGGPYGVGEGLRSRADLTLSLSKLTMNHHVAKIVVLEQVYRALTIWKGLPYHNA